MTCLKLYYQLQHTGYIHRFAEFFFHGWGHENKSSSASKFNSFQMSNVESRRTSSNTNEQEALTGSHSTPKRLKVGPSSSSAPSL
jgi:hypothetical protein